MTASDSSSIPTNRTRNGDEASTVIIKTESEGCPTRVSNMDGNINSQMTKRDLPNSEAIFEMKKQEKELTTNASGSMVVVNMKMEDSVGESNKYISRSDVSHKCTINKIPHTITTSGAKKTFERCAQVLPKNERNIQENKVYF